MSSKKTSTAWTGLAFQMMAVIVLSVYGGIYMDKEIGWKFPLFTVVLSLLGIGLSLFSVIKKVGNGRE